MPRPGFQVRKQPTFLDSLANKAGSMANQLPGQMRDMAGQADEINLMQMLQNALPLDYFSSNPTDVATPMDDGAGQSIPGEATRHPRMPPPSDLPYLIAEAPPRLDDPPLPSLEEAYLGARQRLTDKVGGKVRGVSDFADELPGQMRDMAGQVGDFAGEKARQAEEALIRMLMGIGN